MRRFERRCEENDAPCALRDASQRSRRSRRWRDPYQEHCLNIFQALIDPPERPRVERIDQIALTPGGKIRTLMSQAPGTTSG